MESTGKIGMIEKKQEVIDGQAEKLEELEKEIAI
jgi:hypothetical protein